MIKPEIVFLLVVSIWILGIVGYLSNIYKLVHTDFKAPYKAEVLRGIGIVIPPVGGLEGYLNIKD